VAAPAGGSARLLPRLIAGRPLGPLFLADRRPAPARTPAAADLCPSTGRARLSYRRAEELFRAASGGWTLHQLRHSALTHLAEADVGLALLMAKSRHTSLRSLQRYARPGPDAVAQLTADHDPRTPPTLNAAPHPGSTLRLGTATQGGGHEPADRRRRGIDPVQPLHPALRRQRRGHDRELVHVQRHPQAHPLGGGRANVRHGLVLQCRTRLWPRRPYLTAARLTREPCDRRGPARLGIHPD
jgi:hypothetical protein